MVHIALSGVLQRFPQLKIVAHHGGGLVPFFTERFDVQLSNFDSQAEIEKFKDLQRFYVDTATFGYNPSNIRQCLKFFEKGRVVFGTGEAQILYIYSFSLSLFRYCHDRYSNGHGITWDVYEYSLSKCKRFELVHIR